MKSLITFLFISLLCYSLSSQTLLKGSVTEQHSGKKIAHVAIQAFGGGQDQSEDILGLVKFISG